MTPQDFVAKWKVVQGKEIANAQPHFLDLCDLLGKPKPQPNGEDYTFEESVKKSTGGAGRADVWKRACFAWEYKGPGRNLDKAYNQLLQYKDALDNPPLLIVSDILTIQVHTNFTNSVKKVYAFTLDDLLDAKKLEQLARVFDEPEWFKVEITPDDVTREAAAEFAKLADILRDQGVEPRRAAHYLIQLLFCLFAEDAALVPNNAFSKLVEATKTAPDRFTLGMRQLFGAMATGGQFGFESIPHFNGGLFDTDDAVPLSRNGLTVLTRVTALDWSSIEPSIFGTLFERSLDPSKRAQLGAHYTSRDDILLIVEPVLMAPLRRRWAEVRAEAEELIRRRDAATDRGQRTRIEADIRDRLLGFMREIAGTRILDPACGSGNFLYVSLKALLDLWKEVWLFMGEAGITMPMAMEDVTPSPAQLHGIEINEYAHELAQVTVWIGYIQWLRDNGFGAPGEPILKPLDTILRMDAILAYDEAGRPVEPEWPAAEVIVGNPPFLGGNRIRQNLGGKYVESLFDLYHDRVPAFADLICYWFERARDMIDAGHTHRAGLLATNSIRGGANRRVLERINDTCEIFMAWSDRDWILDGAQVRVSMIGFAKDWSGLKVLDGQSVQAINPDLTSSLDLAVAKQLVENMGIAFQGPSAKAPFDISHGIAMGLLAAPPNINRRPNADVVRPLLSAIDISGRTRGMWTIDFGVMSLEEAALYEAPFEYVRRTVLPVRATRRDDYRGQWWQYARPRPALRKTLKGLGRYIATPAHSKYRLFIWVGLDVLTNQASFVFARDDDYFFGVLHSHPHELWSLRMCTWLGVGNDPRYTPTTTFETFPFPWPPRHEPPADPRVAAIADAARELVEKRDLWLNPAGMSEADMKKRTLTNLYNQRPTWLDLAHKKLDAAVFDAYGWPHDIGDEEILERLLVLNLERGSVHPGP